MSGGREGAAAAGGSAAGCPAVPATQEERSVDRGTVSSSLVLVGDEIRFQHLNGDPAAGEYEEVGTFIR